MIKPRFKEVYFNIAREISSLSYAKRLKVGAIIVKENRICSIGFNGTIPGADNNCEVGAYDEHDEAYLITKPEVIHSEMNALHKLARSHESGEGAAMFCTHSPCLECAKGIIMSGISSFYFENEYRSNGGLEFLKGGGVLVEKRC
jgi:dCMP deaminase